jgi:transposase
MAEDDEEQTERFQMRVSERFLQQIDDWRRTEPDLPPRAEAIRRLVERGISASRLEIGIRASRKRAKPSRA